MFEGCPQFWYTPYCTFADGNAKTSFLRKLKNEFSIFKSPERDLTSAMLLTLDNPKVHFHYPRLLATLHSETVAMQI